MHGYIFGQTSETVFLSTHVSFRCPSRRGGAEIYTIWCLFMNNSNSSTVSKSPTKFSLRGCMQYFVDWNTPICCSLSKLWTYICFQDSSFPGIYNFLRLRITTMTSIAWLFAKKETFFIEKTESNWSRIYIGWIAIR